MQFKLEPGKYYIGDPCYVFNNEWSNICDYMFSDSNENVGRYDSPKGYFVIYGSTAYGDGCYEGSDGNEYAVDSGTLGIVPFDAISIDNKLDLNSEFKLYRIVTFQEPFTVFIDGDGQFNFGRIMIDTTSEDDYYEDYYDDDDE